MARDLPKTYAPKEFEDRIYKTWCDRGYFTADPKKPGPAFSMVIPPPNVTGQLHMGHALDETLQDILVRYKRMQGYNTLWVPGTDHAGIATQIKVEEQLRVNEGLTLRPRTREVPRTGVGMEEQIRRPHHFTVEETRHLLRLDARALHDGRGLFPRRQGSVREPL